MLMKIAVPLQGLSDQFDCSSACVSLACHDKRWQTYQLQAALLEELQQRFGNQLLA